MITHQRDESLSAPPLKMAKTSYIQLDSPHSLAVAAVPISVSSAVTESIGGSKELICDGSFGGHTSTDPRGGRGCDSGVSARTIYNKIPAFRIRGRGGAAPVLIRHSFSTNRTTSKPAAFVEAGHQQQVRLRRTSLGEETLLGRSSEGFRRNCDNCVKKKVKCSGNTPCVMCQRKGLICEFSRKQKPGPKVGSGDFVCLYCLEPLEASPHEDQQPRAQVSPSQLQPPNQKRQSILEHMRPPEGGSNQHQYQHQRTMIEPRHYHQQQFYPQPNFGHTNAAATATWGNEHRTAIQGYRGPGGYGLSGFGNPRAYYLSHEVDIPLFMSPVHTQLQLPSPTTKASGHGRPGWSRRETLGAIHPHPAFFNPPPIYPTLSNPSFLLNEASCSRPSLAHEHGRLTPGKSVTRNDLFPLFPSPFPANVSGGGGSGSGGGGSLDGNGSESSFMQSSLSRTKNVDTSDGSYIGRFMKPCPDMLGGGSSSSSSSSIGNSGKGDLPVDGVNSTILLTPTRPKPQQEEQQGVLYEPRLKLEQPEPEPQRQQQQQQQLEQAQPHSDACVNMPLEKSTRKVCLPAHGIHSTNKQDKQMAKELISFRRAYTPGHPEKS